MQKTQAFRRSNRQPGQLHYLDPLPSAPAPRYPVPTLRSLAAAALVGKNKKMLKKLEKRPLLPFQFGAGARGSAFR